MGFCSVCDKETKSYVYYCDKCMRDVAAFESSRMQRLLEFARLVKDCRPSELPLLPLTAAALLSEMGE
jgi:hypothetical protein